MGREARGVGIRNMIRIIISLIIIILSVLIPRAGVSSEFAEYLPKWMELLQKGNEREKKLALDSLWFLEYPEFRKDIKVFDPILNTLKDKNPSMREAAASSLGKIGKLSKGCCKETQIVPTLIKALEDDHPRVRGEAAKALAYYKDERAIDGLMKRLQDKDPWVKLDAVFALGELKAQRAIEPLLKMLGDDSDWRNKFVQQECVKALRKIGSPKAIGVGGGVTRITPETRRPDGKIVTPGTIRQEISKPPTKLGGIDDETTAKVISVLIRKSDDPYLRALIIGAFAQFKTVEAKDILLKAKEDADEKIRKLALEALLQISAIQPREDLRSQTEPGKKYSEEMFNTLKKSMRDPSQQVRADAVAALGKSGDERAVDLLIEGLSDSDRPVRRNAIEGLGQFRDEKILDSMLPFFGKRESYLDDMEQLATRTFMSVAEKTTREWVFVHRRDGIRHVSKNTFDIPREAKISRRMVHPTAVGRLLDFFNRANREEKLAVLGFFPKFEDERIKGVLLRLLNDPSPELRKRAVSLVPSFFDNSMVPRMIDALKDKDSGVRAEAVGALGEFEDRRALDSLIEGLNDNSPSVREAAIRALKGYEDSRISDSVIRVLNDSSTLVRSAAVWYMREKPDNRAVEALIPLLNDENTIASASAEALAKIGDAKAVDPLIKIVGSEYDRERMLGGDIYLRNSAINALGQIKDKKATPVVIDALQKKELRISAVTALRALKDNHAVPALIKCLSDDDPYVRRLAASALREIGDPAGLEAVKDIPEDKPPPAIGSATPIRPTDLKPPPAAIPKRPLPGSGYSMTMFPKPERREEKQPPPKEEKTTEIPPSPPARVVSKYDPKPQPSVDIKPFLPKLKANDPKIRREATDNLGDAGNQEATDHLVPILKDKDEYVRQAAAKALGKLKDKKAVEPLIVGLKDPDVYVRTFSAWALGEIQDIRAVEPLCNSLFDQETKVKDQSFEALRKFRQPISRTTMVNTLMKNAKIQSSAEMMLSRLISLEGKEVILKALEDPSGDHTRTVRNYIHLMEANIYNVSDIATMALEEYRDRGVVISELSTYISTQTGTPTRSISLLGRFKDRRVLPIYLDLLKKRKDSYYRLNVVNAIGELDDKGAAEPLLQILVDDKEYPGPRNAAAMALGKIGAEEAVDPLIKVLKNKNEENHVRVGAAVALGILKKKIAVEPLINILKDNKEDTQLRISAASSLGNIGDERAIIHLEAAMKDPPDYLRHAVEIALRKIKTGK
jgi:HEAT repeat protein